MADTFEQVNYSGDRLRKTLELAQKIADEWSTQLLTVKMARKIKADAGATTKIQEASAIRNWVHDHVKYVSDPHLAELVGNPLWTLEHGGDCDDMAALAAALLQALGHKANVAAVQWQGREYPTHAVAIDWTAQAVIDPVPDQDAELWPPEGYQVKRLLYLDRTGEIRSLDGLFSKIVKAIAKPIQKVFKPKTLVGKIFDTVTLGITNPKRNLNLLGRVADVAGTAATLAVGAYAVGAAAGGTGGFWATAGTGASTIGSGLKAAALAVGKTSAAKTLGTTMLLGALAKPQAAPQAQEAPAMYGDQAAMYAATGDGSGMYAGGGGGGGFFGGGSEVVGVDQAGRPIYAPSQGVPPWVWMAAAGVGVVLLASNRKRR